MLFASRVHHGGATVATIDVKVDEGTVVLSRSPLIAARGFVRPEVVRSLTRTLSLAAIDTCAFLVATDSDSVLLARGPFGGHSLYYAWSDNGAFYASSELSRLLAVLGHRPLDLAKLATTAADIYHSDASATHYQGVYRLRSGESLLVSASGISRRLELPATEFVDWIVDEPEHLAVELRRRIQVAVERSVEGLGKVAVLVGGLDSSGLVAALAIARGASGREIAMLTLDIDDPSTDAPYVDAVARAFGIVPIHVPTHEQPLTAPAVLDAQPNPSGARELTLCTRARELGVDAILTGDGGDDIFGGDLTMLGSSVLFRDPLAAIKTAALSRFPFEGTRPKLVWQLALWPAIRLAVPKAARHRRVARTLKRRLPWATKQMLEFLAAALSENDKVRATELRTPQDLLEAFAGSQAYLDSADAKGQVESVTGLPRVDPFYDPDLARFATAVRPDLLQTSNVHRGLLRLALRGELPDHVRLRVGKARFSSDVAAMAKRDPGTDTLLSLRELEALELVDGTAFRRAWETANAQERGDRLVPFIAAEAFARWHRT